MAKDEDGENWYLERTRTKKPTNATAVGKNKLDVLRKTKKNRIATKVLNTYMECGSKTPHSRERNHGD